MEKGRGKTLLAGNFKKEKKEKQGVAREARG